MKRIQVRDEVTESVLSTLETLRDVFNNEGCEYARDRLDDAISELQQGLPVVGSTK